MRIWNEVTPAEVRLWFEDNGIGIPKEAQDRLLGIFQRVHSEKLYPGTGIGLAIVHQAIERMGAVCEGRQAIDYLAGKGKFADRKEYPLPCLVLLDLKLPLRLGLEVLAWIRQQPGLKTLIVILSSSINDRDVARAYEPGANAFVVKPSDADVLADMCASIKHFWLAYNQSAFPS